VPEVFPYHVQYQPHGRSLARLLDVAAPNVEVGPGIESSWAGTTLEFVPTSVAVRSCFGTPLVDPSSKDEVSRSADADTGPISA
jgi:hypothetical protein